MKVCNTFDCIKIALINQKPTIVFKVPSLRRLAIQYDLVIEGNEYEAHIVEPPEHEELWRKDQEKIRDRAHRDGHYLTPAAAWDRAALAMVKRLAAKYGQAPSEAMIERRKRQETLFDDGIFEPWF